MIVRRLEDLVFDDVFVDLVGLCPGRRVLLKLEQFNPTGSIKFKAAREMLDELQHAGVLAAGTTVIESSSGNLGVALAFLCARRGYRFICVADPNALPGNLRQIEAYGGQVVMVTDRDAGGGFLSARLKRVRELLREHPGAVWTNQYANDANACAHMRHTAPAVLAHVPELDVLLVGAGTTGTLLGCMRYFKRAAPLVRVVAVDSVGSVTFGGTPSARRLPGIGTGVRPALAADVDELGRPPLHMVSEPEAIAMCRHLLNCYGLLVGASTGTVMCGLVREAQLHPPGACLVAISPDGGERYLDTVFNDQWVRQSYPAEELQHA